MGVDYGSLNHLIRDAVHGPFNQGERLSNHQNLMMRGIRKPAPNMLMVALPGNGIGPADPPTQTMIGYTYPVQRFTTDLYWNSPSGKAMRGTGKVLDQPNTKVAQPRGTIQTRMPWNR